MPSFFDLQRYAATGQASPDMTAFDKMRALAAFGGSTVQTLTGIPPLTFKADGKPLISWSMKGNGQQQGTPTPDNPVMPEFVGVETGNLFDYVAYFSSTFTAYSAYFDYADIQLAPNTTYTFSTNFNEGETSSHTKETPFIVMNGNTTPTTAAGGLGNKTTRALTTDSSGVVRVYKRIVSNSQAQIPTLQYFQNGKWVMCSLSSTALPYEPFGWAEKITNAGQTVPVYLGQVSTERKIKKYEFTGNEDSLRLFTNSAGKIGFSIEKRDMLSDSRTNGFCTHFAPVQSISWEGGNKVCFGANNTIIYFIFSDAMATQYNITDLTSIKAYLQTQYTTGSPVTVWYILTVQETATINEPLAKIGDYADELHSSDAGVTIPTIKGQNTLTVETELQPSEMTIRYRE